MAVHLSYLFAFPDLPADLRLGSSTPRPTPSMRTGDYPVTVARQFRGAFSLPPNWPRRGPDPSGPT